MYQYTFDEDTTNKLKNSTKNSNEILEKFNEIDSKFDNFTKEANDLNLSTLSFEKPSDDEIKTKANNNLFEYKNTSIDAINSKYDDKIKDINSDLENVKTTNEKALDTIKENYNQVKESQKNDAIKRGLARSSIIVNKLSNLDNGMLNDLKAQQNLTNQKIDSLNGQKSLLEQQKQNALNSFDITYAVKLQNEIDEINSDIANKEQAAIKYNNQIAEIEAKWNKQMEDELFARSKDLTKLYDEYGSDAFKMLKQNEKYSVLSEYLNSLSKEDALLELENSPVYKDAIGQTNYNKLKNKINSKN